jgi:hypothetical protein
MASQALPKSMIAGELRERGFCVVRDALPADVVAALDADLAPHFERTPFGEGAFYGTTTKRFGRLLLRSRHAARLGRHPPVRAAVRAAPQVVTPRMRARAADATLEAAFRAGVLARKIVKR